jgi:hypothetical protein
MIARSVGGGWQTILADLSLILFMVTASALANAPDGPLGTGDGDAKPRQGPPPAPKPGPVPHPAIMPLPQAEPVAVWRAGAGVPSLPRWLDDVARDPRLRLTITVHYAPGGRSAALAQALRLDAGAGARAGNARIIVEPGQPAGASAAVAFDADAAPSGPAHGTQFARHGP